MEIAIHTQSLTKSYKSYEKTAGLIGSLKGFINRKHLVKIAVQPTNLSIASGEIVGLVGANGAGKTTLLKMLSGLIHPTSGKASVLGYKPHERHNEFLKQISILLGQKNQLWWDISPADSFQLLASIYEIPQKVIFERSRHLAQVLKCEEQLHVQLRRLSLGERMKMEIIGSLLHEPKVLYLDEPTIGLDIVAQTTIREFLLEYKKTHKPTVILTSHYMDDIAQLADRLLLISKGHLVYDGTVKNFSSRNLQKQRASIKIEKPLAQNLVFEGDLIGREGMELLEFEIPNGKLGQALKTIVDHATIQQINIEETNFEDVIHEFLEKELGPNKTGHSHPI